MKTRITPSQWTQRGWRRYSACWSKSTVSCSIKIGMTTKLSYTTSTRNSCFSTWNPSTKSWLKRASKWLSCMPGSVASPKCSRRPMWLFLKELTRRRMSMNYRGHMRGRTRWLIRVSYLSWMWLESENMMILSYSRATFPISQNGVNCKGGVLPKTFWKSNQSTVATVKACFPTQR